MALPLTALAARWAALLALSVALSALFGALHLPASLLLGPMLAGILLAARDHGVQVPRLPFLAAQAVIGCMIARTITPDILAAMLRDWPLLLGTIAAVIGASGLLGWTLARLRVLPGSTAVWGSSPGAASAMILMAEAYGADVRLVAFMQYLRVVLVSITATAVARLSVPGGLHAAAAVAWFPPLAWAPFAATLLLVAAGAVLAPRLKLPAGPLMLPLALGVLLHDGGALTIVLPPWLLAGSYALIGWSIGLRFSRGILRHALGLLPRVLAAIAALIALCGGFAWVLVHAAGVSPLTAYLATSPGGADSVAIIAASSPVDVPFVMALQTARFVVVLLVGPTLARLVVRWSGMTEAVAVPGA